MAGALARLALDGHQRSLLWAIGSAVVLTVTVWAARRVLRAGEPILALICVALCGLVVSPVSWSHHWVWLLPAVVVTGTVARRRRAAGLAVLTAAGVVLMVWSPLSLLPEHHEMSAPWWRQVVGVSYMWWALAVIITAGGTLTPGAAPPRRSAVDTVAPEPAVS